MNDATGLAEALLGLDGFRVLSVKENPAEVVVTVETIADVVGCMTLWGAGRSPGSLARRHPRPALLRSSGPPGLDEAAVALSRPRLCGQDLDRGLPHVPSRAVFTVRAGWRRPAKSVSWPAGRCRRPRVGVCWWTVMDAVTSMAPRSSTTPTGWARCGPSASTRPRSSRPTGSTPPSTRPDWSTSTAASDRHGRGQRRP